MFRLNENFEEAQVKLLYYLNSNMPYKLMVEERKLKNLKSDHIEISRSFARTLWFPNSYRASLRPFNLEENPSIRCVIRNPWFLAKAMAIFFSVLSMGLSLSVPGDFEATLFTMAFAFLGFGLMYEYRDRNFFHNSSQELIKSIKLFFPKLEVINER